MNATVIGLTLSAAILHAAWNSFLRTGADRLWTMTVMSLPSTLLALVLIFVFPMPPAAAWPYIVISATLQVSYSVFLVAAYRLADLGQVYAIVRGSAPLFVTVYGYLLIGEKLGSYQLCGIVLIAGGIMGLSLGKIRASVSALVYALAAGAMVACYTTLDAIGVRLVGHSGSYLAWALIFYGIFYPAMFMIARGRLPADIRPVEFSKAFASGIVAIMAYILVLTALHLGPAGPIAALRETSVIFAILIGWLFLGEALTARRLAACLVVTAGVISLSFASIS